MHNANCNNLARIIPAKSLRASSWDQTGGNIDCIKIAPGETAVLADIDGPGMVTHLYFTMIQPSPLDYRDAVIKMYWDGEETPSVEVPFGDFFCISNCTVRRFTSLMMSVNLGGDGHTVNNGINCYFPMPFANGARIELENQGAHAFGGAYGRVWYHVDYEVYDEAPPANLGRFHAQWRRANPTKPVELPNPTGVPYGGVNLTGDNNYTMLEAEGEGHIAGVFLQVNNLCGGWWGEGDDMIFVDGDTWPPSQHGTGSEEVFGGGACPDKEYAGPYTGFLLVENADGEKFKGLNAMYRWYLQDPIRFNEKVRMTIEHGHANDLANDYSSVAYWYQHEPHAAFPVLPPVEARRPIMPDGFDAAVEAFGTCCDVYISNMEKVHLHGQEAPPWHTEFMAKIHAAYDPFYSKDYAKAEAIFREALALAGH